MKRNYFVPIVIATIFILSCGSDTSKELSGGYFFRDEGSDVHDILNHSAGYKEIPANILSYNFDRDFIIASQRPSKNPDPLYNSTTIYKNGLDTIYYWIIIHKDKSVVGPMDAAEFQEVKRQYKIPESLQLQAVD